jgi:hypothetical protein
LLLLCVQLYFLLEKYYYPLQNTVKQGFTLKSTFKKSYVERRAKTTIKNTILVSLLKKVMQSEEQKPLILNLKIFIIKELFWLHLSQWWNYISLSVILCKSSYVSKFSNRVSSS